MSGRGRTTIEPPPEAGRVPHPSWPTRETIEQIARLLPDLLRFGTSSWNYPGWTGLVYEKSYPANAPVSRQLKEYARWPLFRTVGVDSFFYRPAGEKTLRDYAAALPEGFPCITKVWDRVTAHTFANPKDTERLGQRNPDWLNAELFVNEVLGPMREHFAGHIGPFVFEFQTIARSERIDAARFAERLDRFFSALPTDVPYSVEVRNEEYLADPYFAVLRQHNVAHLFSAWTRMPSIGEQLLLHDSITADFIVMRALNRQGRTFQQAVEAFAPYDHVQDENPVLRDDIVALAKTALQLRVPAYLLVGNRAEGSSPLTIAAVAKRVAEAT